MLFALISQGFFWWAKKPEKKEAHFLLWAGFVVEVHSG